MELMEVYRKYHMAGKTNTYCLPKNAVYVWGGPDSQTHEDHEYMKWYVCYLAKHRIIDFKPGDKIPFTKLRDFTQEGKPRNVVFITEACRKCRRKETPDESSIFRRIDVVLFIKNVKDWNILEVEIEMDKKRAKRFEGTDLVVIEGWR